MSYMVLEVLSLMGLVRVGASESANFIYNQTRDSLMIVKPPDQYRHVTGRKHVVCVR